MTPKENSEVKVPKNYRRSDVSIPSVRFSIGGKEITLLPVDIRNESGEFDFAGWKPLHGKENTVKCSGALQVLSETLTDDFRSRSVTIAGEVFNWSETYPVARKGENKGKARKNAVRVVEHEIKVKCADGRELAATVKVTLGGTDDRETDTLSAVANLESTGHGGRTAKPPAETDDDF